MRDRNKDVVRIMGFPEPIVSFFIPLVDSLEVKVGRRRICFGQPFRNGHNQEFAVACIGYNPSDKILKLNARDRGWNQQFDIIEVTISEAEDI